MNTNSNKENFLGVLDETEEFFLLKKPCGWATHASSPWSLGFAEFIGQKLATPVFVVHRLDVGTSGLLLLAKSKNSAEKLSEKFRNREIKKRYHFLTDHIPPAMNSANKEWRVESFLERGADKITRTIPGKESNAITLFKVVAELNQKKDSPLYLIGAEPVTGKSHQIRAHARESGIPILGDTSYGGTEAIRLFLAATHLELDGKVYEDPFWREDFAVGTSRRLLDITQQSLIQRRSLMSEKEWTSTESAWRWLHQEDPDFEIDILGDVLWISLRNSQRADEVKENLDSMISLSPKKISKCYVMMMAPRGQKSLKKELYEYEGGRFIQPQVHEWIVKEGPLSFVLRNNIGFSPGLFLDQRENRKWTQNHSRGKNVLNLFAYSGGFSVHAARGGAKSVCTVDLSPTFLNWTKDNLKINNLCLDLHEFWSQDSLLFLKGCLKRNRTFDLIVCDPPSLGRTKEGVFKIEKEWTSLLQLCLACLSPSGTVLFSTNFEKWTHSEWLKKIQTFLSAGRFPFSLQAGLRCPDFEPFQIQPSMKSFIIKPHSKSKRPLGATENNLTL